MEIIDNVDLNMVNKTPLQKKIGRLRPKFRSDKAKFGRRNENFRYFFILF